MNFQDRKRTVDQKHYFVTSQARGLEKEQSGGFHVGQNRDSQANQNREPSAGQKRKLHLSAKVQAIHTRALAVTAKFKSAEAELIDILGEMDETRGYLEFEVTSIYAYASQILKLSEDTSYNLISVARKSREVPALKEAIRSGVTTASKARKVISVITRENQDAWLKLLSQAPARQIEKEVARVNPKAATPEVMRYTSHERLSLQLGISEETAEKLKRVQDLVSQSKDKPASLEEALDASLEEYLEHRDPVRKTQRALKRKEVRDKAQSSLKRKEPGDKALGAFEKNESSAQKAHGSSKEDSLNPVLKTQSIERLTDSTKTPSDDRPQQDGTTSSSVSVTGRKSESTQSPKLLDRSQQRPSSLQRAITHVIHARDGFRCTEHGLNGDRCPNTRFLDIHHIIPRSLGGSDDPTNLTTLCRTHHQKRHQEFL